MGNKDTPQAGPSQQSAPPPRALTETTLQAVQQRLGGITIAQEVASLDDLPAAWLLQLPPRLTPDACLAVFRTCKTMRDLMLSQRRSVRTQFRLPRTTAAAAAAQATLQRACQQARAVMLAFEGRLAIASGSTSSARTLLTNTMSSLGHPLLAITSVDLRGLSIECLDGLVPAWLRSTCPNMTSLTLDTCSYSSLPDPTTSIPAYGQLQELCLVRGPQSGSGQGAVAHWQHQFRSLTGLQRLSVTGQERDCWLEAGSTVATQITQLSCCSDDLFYKLPARLPAWFPNVTDLHVPSLRVKDCDMEVLLRMPSLKRVWFSHTQLQHSYVDRPCGWTDIHFQGINMDELARWPLGGQPSLHAVQPAADKMIEVVPSADLQDGVVAAIAACGGIQWGSVDHFALMFAGSNATTAACLAASLSILSGCRASHLTVRGTVTPLVLTTMQLSLASLPITHVEFEHCRWEHADVFALLLPSLPAHVHTVSLNIRPLPTYNMFEPQFTKVCVNAHRAVTVQVLRISKEWLNVSPKWQAGWQQRVKEAMTRAGHQHVTLM